MKDVVDIFVVDENGLLTINKKEARTVPSYRDIIARDKGGTIDGDHDGRKKYFAFKELLYVYLYYHPQSMYRDLPDDARGIRVINHCEFPGIWKPDALIKTAGKDLIKQLKLTALFFTYWNANKGVFNIGQDLEFFNNRRNTVRNKIEEYIAELDVTTTEDRQQELEAMIHNLSNTLMDIGTKINKITTDLPAAFDTIETLKKKVLKEQGALNAVYGGGVIGNREK